MSMKLTSNSVFWQSKVHLHLHKDYVWRLCPEQLANISHFSTRLAEKGSRKKTNNFAWAVIMLLKIPGTSQMYFYSFKGCYQRGYYCREYLYSQIRLKVWDSKEKLAFSSRLPLRCRIAWLGMFSVDSGILVSLYASAHHPHTTLYSYRWVNDILTQRR